MRNGPHIFTTSKKESDMELKKEEMELFHSILMETASMPEVTEMKKFIQHGKVTCYDHCLAVAYTSFLISRRWRIKVNDASLIRGALLHDFFLYDWHIKEEPRKLHGFHHPFLAWKNACKLFELDPIEKDIIVKHMWPLTVVPPKYIESYVICLADKICSLQETFHMDVDRSLHLAGETIS